MSEFTPDLGKFKIADLLRLSYDVEFRRKCYREADPDLVIEDACDGTAKAMVLGPGKRIANKKNLRISELKITIEHYKAVADLIDGSKLANSNSGAVLDEIAETGEDCEIVTNRLGVMITATADDLSSAIDAAINANAKIVADYRGGKQSAIGAIIGAVMKSRKGLDPKRVREELEKALSQRI